MGIVKLSSIGMLIESAIVVTRTAENPKIYSNGRYKYFGEKTTIKILTFKNVNEPK